MLLDFLHNGRQDDVALVGHLSAADSVQRGLEGASLDLRARVLLDEVDFLDHTPHDLADDFAHVVLLELAGLGQQILRAVVDVLFQVFLLHFEETADALFLDRVEGGVELHEGELLPGGVHVVVGELLEVFGVALLRHEQFVLDDQEVPVVEEGTY